VNRVFRSEAKPGIHSRGLTSKGFYIRTGRTKNILEMTLLSLLEVCGFP
jgi:hypothetical protein